jgi:hypothetical protein
MSKMKMAEARSTKALMKHPVFEQEYDFKTKYGLNLSEDRVFELKKIFAIANQNKSGVIGRKQFVDLMALLRISPTEVRAGPPGRAIRAAMRRWVAEGQDSRACREGGARFLGLMSSCRVLPTAGRARQDDDRDGRERRRRDRV